MQKEDIQNLAELSMLEISPKEIEILAKEMDGIVAYISKLNEVAAATMESQLGEVYNVVREDVVTNEPGSCTESMLAAAPRRDGRHVAVKKILNQ